MAFRDAKYEPSQAATSQYPSTDTHWLFNGLITLGMITKNSDNFLFAVFPFALIN